MHEYPAGRPETQRSDTVPFQLPTEPMLMGTANAEPLESAANWDCVVCRVKSGTAR
jgi:hypothetical protein